MRGRPRNESRSTARDEQSPPADARSGDRERRPGEALLRRPEAAAVCGGISWGRFRLTRGWMSAHGPDLGGLGGGSSCVTPRQTCGDPAGAHGRRPPLPSSGREARPPSCWCRLLPSASDLRGADLLDGGSSSSSSHSLKLSSWATMKSDWISAGGFAKRHCSQSGAPMVHLMIKWGSKQAIILVVNQCDRSK